MVPDLANKPGVIMKNTIFGLVFLVAVGLIAALIGIKSTPTVDANESQTQSTEAPAPAPVEAAPNNLVAEVTKLHKDTIMALDAYDGMLWSTTVKVKGIKREPYLDKAEKAMAAGDYAAAKAHLEVVNTQLALAKEQAEYQANGGWEKEAAFLLGTK